MMSGGGRERLGSEGPGQGIDVGRRAREAGEVRGHGNATYHFHFHALAQQVAANPFLTQSSCYTRLLSSIVCTSQAGQEGHSLSVCQSTLQD